MNSKKFIVASASPRRKELLENIGYKFEIIPSDADETLEEGIKAEEAVETLAERKAMSAFEKNKDTVVLGCDTVVALDEKILGKPSSKKEAFEMLSLLSGKTHKVYSGLCIVSSEKKLCRVSCAEVEFYKLTDETIKSYIETNEPMDKAGAYGIQGIGSVLVKKISGDYFTIVGLPLSICARELGKFGIFGSVKI